MKFFVAQVNLGGCIQHSVVETDRAKTHLELAQNALTFWVSDDRSAAVSADAATVRKEGCLEAGIRVGSDQLVQFADPVGFCT